jgi:excisionase family DNA binding protein
MALPRSVACGPVLHDVPGSRTRRRVRLEDVVKEEGRRFATLNEVAKRYGLTYQTVYAMARRGRLPAFKVGGTGTWRVNMNLLERFENEWVLER